MLKFILADLRRLWPGALVVVLLVALAVALGTAITLGERAIRLGSARASEKFDLVIGAPGSEAQLVLSTVFLQPAALPLLPGSVLPALAADPRVAWAAPVGFGDFAAGHPVVGTTTALIRGTTTGFTDGRLFAAEGEAVLGSAVDLPLGSMLTPSHGEIDHGGHDHEGVHYKVVGRLAPTGTPWDRAILVPIQAVWHVHGLGDHDEDAQEEAGHAESGHEETGPEQTGHDAHDHVAFDAAAPLDETLPTGADAPGVPAVLVKPVNFADAYRLRQEYRMRPDSVAVFPAEVLTALYALMGDARQLLAAVAAAAQGLVAGAMLLVAVLHVGQRRRQIGALRAFGAPRGAIFAMVWGELFLLGAVSIALGTGLGALVARVMTGAVAARQGFPLPVEFAREDLLSLSVLILVAALMPLLPATLVWRQPPVSALRG